MIPFGLDVSDRSIEVLQLNQRKKIKAFGRVLLEKGIIENGNIINEEKLALKIREVVKKSKARGRKVVFSLPESKVFIHFFEDREDVSGQAKKIIPLDLNEVYFNIKGGLYVAVPKKIIDSYIAVLERAGLDPLAAETESVSLARTLDAKDCLIADIGARTTNISIFDKNGNLRLSTAINKAGNHFSGALAKTLDVSLKEAEELKKKCGLDQSKKNGRVLFILQKEFQVIVGEIKKAIDFYGEDVRCIILAGGSAKMPKIADYFFSNLNINTVIAESSVAKQLKEKSALFNVAVGLALRETSSKSFKINLMPDKGKKPFFKMPLFYFSVVFAILGLIFLGYIFYNFIFIPFSDIPGFDFIVPKKIERQEQTAEEIITVSIKETPTGWLRVREGPGIEYASIDRVFSGESFPLLEQKDDWCKIKIEGRTDGWISAKYVIINNY